MNAQYALSGVTRRTLQVLVAAVIFRLAAPSVLAQGQAPSPTWSQEDGLRIVKEIQKRVGSLTTLSVFDWITFGFHGKTVVVRGYASRPIVKSDIGNALKGLPGVESIDNQIEVLPTSNSDDRTRAAVYNSIYTQASLRKYNANQGTVGQASMGGSVARRAGGITNDPPRGFHAIHIIVKNGNVSLWGDVLNEGDAAIAAMQANTVFGVFSVDNNLAVEGSKTKPKEK